MRFGSVCSGIEAASVAWEPIGWEAAWFSEIEPFPSAVLAHHYPETPNLGDMTQLPPAILSGDVEAPDVLCGGTPCQAFSVAGLRQSLDDARGNLSLTFCEIANAIDTVRSDDGREPAIVFWENVPGVISTKDNAFGCFLAGLAGENDPLVAPGGKWTDAGFVLGPQRAVAWRVLDAQYFGLAQRRRRVFVVASARDWFDPASVLFEREGVRRDSPPSREAWKGVAASTGAGVDLRNGALTGDIAHTIQSGQHAPDPGGTPHVLGVAHALRGEGFDASEDGTPLVPVPMINMQGSKGNAVAQADGPSFTLNAMHGHDVHAVAVPRPTTFDTTQITSQANYSRPQAGDPCHPLAAGAHPIAFHPTQDPITSEDGSTHAMGCGSIQGNATVAVATPFSVRRLTPVECERLQGFPDGYTAIPWRGKPASECPDGPRYKALGNSWAVPVVRWIGQRIQEHINE